MKQELLQLCIFWNQGRKTEEIATELGWLTPKGQPAVNRVTTWVKKLRKQGVELYERRRKALELSPDEVADFNKRLSQEKRR